MMRLAGRIEPGSAAGPFTGQPAGRFGLAVAALSRAAAGRAVRCDGRLRALPALLAAPLLVMRLRAVGDAVGRGWLSRASPPWEDWAAAGRAASVSAVTAPAVARRARQRIRLVMT